MNAHGTWGTLIRRGDYIYGRSRVKKRGRAVVNGATTRLHHPLPSYNAHHQAADAASSESSDQQSNFVRQIGSSLEIREF